MALKVKNGDQVDVYIKGRGAGTAGDPHVGEQDANIRVAGADVSTSNRVPVALPDGYAQEGTDATGVTPLTGGSGARGWLSSIYQVLSTRLPTLISGRLPVEAIGTVALDTATLAALEQTTVTISNPPSDPATETRVQAVVTSLGTDGTSPPALPGGATGVRGWLRLFYDTLVARLPLTGGRLAVEATGTVALDSATLAALEQTSVTVSNPPSDPATETRVQAVVTSLGTDGTSPPALPGGATGVRGWLRLFYDTLVARLPLTGGRLAVDGSGATQPVSIAAPVVTRPGAGPANLIPVSDTTVSTVLLAANASRLFATIFNDSTATLYVACAATASSTAFTDMLYTNDRMTISGYAGIISGVWSADTASGAARVTEVTL